MVVDAVGRAYVGNFGYDLLGGAPHVDATLARVETDGTACVAAKGLQFPNGAVITPDGRELIVAETMARRLTSYSIDEKGRLSNRQQWAGLGRATPDGICLDVEGCVWVADPRGSQAIRVRRGGEVIARLATDVPCVSVALGGPARGHLYVACNPTLSEKEAVRLHGAKILVAEAPASGGGWP
jgi:sugar lactone lactonase YvrE